MYLIIYYDPGTNRIEIEEYQLESVVLIPPKVKHRIKELREAGASTIKMVRVDCQTTITELVRT